MKMLRLIALLLSLFFLDGCAMFPNWYQEAHHDTWDKVVMNYGISLELPKDKRMTSYYNPKENYVRMGLFRVIPGSVGEPITFVDVNVKISEKNKAQRLLYGEERNKVYKVYLPEPDSLIYECRLDVNSSIYVDCCMEIIRIKEIGNDYYRRNKHFFSNAQSLFNTILCSIKYENKGMSAVLYPQKIAYTDIVFDGLPVGYDLLFHEIFPDSKQIKYITYSYKQNDWASTVEK